MIRLRSRERSSPCDFQVVTRRELTRDTTQWKKHGAGDSLYRGKLLTWGVAMPNLLSRLAAASKNPSLPGRLRLEFEIMARQINAQFNAIRDTPDRNTANPELYD
jgi:hypothetical protein